MTSANLPIDPGELALTRSTIDFPVVGLGASAGGLQALTRFFEHMPADNGMAFVVVLHLSPKHVSNVDSLLQRVTRMPVRQVTDSVPIEANHVYVVPPNRQLTMNDGYLGLRELERPRGRQVLIDLFFRSLAVVHRERAVGIVLSGAGADGAVGITRLKEQGGVTLAQNPGDAEYEDMPRAAIATQQIDWVLPAAEMPQRLLDMWANARRIELPAGDDELLARAPSDPQAQREAEDALRDIMVLLRARTGHDFRHYKRATVLRRLERRLQVNGLPSLPAYREHLRSQPEEAQALLKDLLIGVTNFFRDPEAFDALQRAVIEELIPALGRADPGDVRVWVPGCATGEEAYSLAMLLAERAEAVSSPPELHVFASDIDAQAVAMARAGAYPESIVADVPANRLRHFFTKESNHYRIRKEVRERMLFAAHNILRDPPFSRLDLISCRNLLIYLDREVHSQVLEMFHFALRPGGYLFLGSSESADAVPQLFSVVDKKHRVYRANAVARPSRHMPALTLGAATEPTRVTTQELPGQKRRDSYAEVHQRLVEQHAPPSVLADADGNIVHLSERAGRFLRQPGGAPSHQLLAVVQPELRPELRTALFQALRSRHSVEARPVQVERDGRRFYVSMTVRPVLDHVSNAELLLLLFDEVEDTTGGTARQGSADDRDPVIQHLEDELRRTKEQLQSTVEHADTSTEELKASNEELQAINEELRSTTEELETSKEELQSINEELITVNHELKMKVEETSKINDDLQNLIASTDIATVFIDRGMSIKRYTPRATEIFSIIPSDIGRSLFDITHRLDYERLAEDAGEAFAALRLIEREVPSSDGRWYLARILPYRTTEDRIDGAVLTFVDVTKRRHAEERLELGEERMRLVAESTRDYAIITTDVDGRITTWNQGAERIFGWSDVDAVGQPIDILFLPEDVERGEPAAEMLRARQEGRAEDERWHRRRDGSSFYCSGITTPLFNAGTLYGYGKIARDLTGRKHAESAREAALAAQTARRAEAQAASQLKDEFLAIVSHELKNPLNLIQLNAELLARLPEARSSPALARAAATIRKTVMSQAQIIDDLMDLSRVNTGKLALHPEPVDLTGVVQGIATAMHGDAQGKGVALAVVGEPLVVHADRVRTEQIVWNLLSNALKFTPAGGRIEARLRADGDEGVLQVTDTGAGVAPEFLPKLFEMFQQGEPGARRQGGGMGIGLALVKHIAELHGGSVEAASEGVGRGSRFTVRLPLKAGGNGGAHDRGAARHLPVGLRVLVVEDDRATVETLRELLTMEGASVVLAHDGREALAALDRQAVDVVVSDLAMPRMDGYELLAAIRARPDGADLPVVALTGLARPAAAQHLREAGFSAALDKPFTLDGLTQVLQRVMVQRQAGE